MKSMPLIGKIAMGVAFSGLCVGLFAYFFLESDSKYYGLLVSAFKLIWAACFILYILTFAVYLGGGEKDEEKSNGRSE